MKKLEGIILKNAKTDLVYRAKAIDKANSLAELDKAYKCFCAVYEAYAKPCREYCILIYCANEFLKKMQDTLNKNWDSAKHKYNERLKHYVQLN